jgi:hypothetical protein
MAHLDPFEEGLLLGILAGEGHFGGDGKQAQVTVRMHTRHEKLFVWLREAIPGSKVYGPYSHGGRDYYQWMARGQILRQMLLPILKRHLPMLDDYVRQRIENMIERYGLED